MHPGAHNYTDKSMCTRELVIADAKWCSAYCPPATLLVQNFLVTDKKHGDKKHGDKKHGGSWKSMVVLGINGGTRKGNMVPFDRNMVALKKKICYQKKHADTKKKWRHHEEHCLAAAQCQNVKSAIIWAEARTQSPFCALNANKAFVLCSQSAFCVLAVLKWYFLCFCTPEQSSCHSPKWRSNPQQCHHRMLDQTCMLHTEIEQTVRLDIK